jgi:hypothetical protein
MRQAIRVVLLLAVTILVASACQAEVTTETVEEPAESAAPMMVIAKQTPAPETPVTSQPATPSVPTVATIPVLIPATSPTIITTVAPTHRIGVRTIEGESQFYDRQTGQVFVPRGFNYVRLAPMPGAPGDIWHATLNPGYYDPQRVEAALAQMEEYGYNMVRIFIDCCRPGVNAGDPQGGILQAYLENTIDFLNKANAHGIYVLMIFDLTPAQGGYDEMWQHCCTTFDGENLRYLTHGGHAAERRFNRDFIRALIKQGAPMESIFAYDLTNEVSFSLDKPPFSLDSGKVTTANGQTYDMSKAEDKQRMMDENLVFWINQQRASILEVDPTALVTVSFPAINTGQTTVDPGPAVYKSTADFVDLHTYIGWGLSLDQYMQHFGITEPVEKPIILGEFGAARRAYPSADGVARALLEWQAASCDYGFDGWLFWTWDVEGQDELWHGLSQSGEIAAALSPAERPDPCAREQ